MSKNSIYFEKCECGKPINYWELKKKYYKETQISTNKYFKIFSVLMAILIIIDVIFSYRFLNDIINDWIFYNGFFFGFITGLCFTIFILEYLSIKMSKNFDPNKKRKEYYRYKVKKAYYKSLPKSDKSFINKWKAISLSITLIPYIIWLFVMLYIIEDPITEIRTALILIGFIIYLAWWKIDPLDKVLKKIYQRKLEEYGIDYQRLSKGVKSIE